MKTFAEAKKAWSEEKSLGGYWFPRAWKRSAAIVDILDRFQVPKNVNITEFGVGGRRNLVALWDAGYISLAGYDITDRLDVFRFGDFCTIVVDDDPYKMPECDLCITMATLQHVTDDRLDMVASAIAQRTKQMILICENERDIRDGTYPRDYFTLFKEKGWQHVWWMPACDVDGLDPHYCWRIFIPNKNGK